MVGRKDATRDGRSIEMRFHRDNAGDPAGGSPISRDPGAGATEATCRPPAEQAAQPDPRRQERNQKLMLGIGAGILVVLLCGGMFAVGFAVGNRSDTNGKVLGLRSTGTGLGRQQGTGQQQAAGGAARGAAQQKVQQWLQQQDATLVRGQVTGVNDGSVNVQTPDGEQTIALTEETRVLGAGQAAGSGATGGSGTGAARDLKQGERIVVAVRKGADGKLEALALKRVRAGVDTQPVR